MNDFKKLYLTIGMTVSSFMSMRSLFNLDISEFIAWGILLIISINKIMGGNSTYRK